MYFNVNEMLSAFSFTLDYVERDMLQDVTNHSRRVAYVAARIAQRMGFEKEPLFDLISYALLHDNGITQSLIDDGTVNIRTLEHNPRHSVAGEKNIIDFPFFQPRPNVLLYHHENYDGSGAFQKKGEEIPLFSRVIALANCIAVEYGQGRTPQDIIGLLRASSALFDPMLLDVLYRLSQNVEFWLNMQPIFVEHELKRLTPQVYKEFSYQTVRKISQLFSRIIDAKSAFTGEHSRGISEKAGIMSRYYGYDEDTYWKMRIAADLHDLGKIMIPNEILDKPGSLSRAEIDVIQSHTYYTRKALEGITGFAEITEWAANHHEKLNGRGYPLGLPAEKLDFNSRLMACIDVYQALTEERPYREALPHEKAIDILRTMARQNLVQSSIVDDIDLVLRTVRSEEELHKLPKRSKA